MKPFVKKQLLFIIMVTATLFSCLGYCQALDIAKENNSALGSFATIITEYKKAKSMADVLLEFQRGGGYQSKVNYLTFGLNSDAQWVIIPIENHSLSTIKKRVAVETSWLDSVDFYLYSNEKILIQQHLGDKYPFHSKVIDSRYFELDIDFPIENSVLLIRVESPDPMVIPLYIRDIEKHYQALTIESFRYGIVYGAIIALMLYNLFIAVSIKSRANLLYSLYMFAFLLMNISYTGHGFSWFWPSSAVFQKWSNIVFMTGHVVAGLLFSIEFLLLKKNFRKLYNIVLICLFLIVTPIALSILFDNHAISIKLAFINTLIFALLVMSLGVIAIIKKIQSASYFFFATLMGIGGALITCSTVWGLIEYNAIAYLSVEIGMMLEAIILSLALAEKYNRIETEKNSAIQLANIDPLTQLNNRRALYADCQNLLQSAQNKKHEISVIMIDLDDFKYFNDTYGHEVGDTILKEVALILAQESRGNDVLARWGGEEFIVVLPDTSLALAVLIAERFRVAINKEVILRMPDKLVISASIGVVSSLIYSKDKSELKKLINLADKLLYKAKSLGKNCVAY
jgi:diguanylate cyclase (GGDEF)-like protein